MQAVEAPHDVQRPYEAAADRVRPQFVLEAAQSALDGHFERDSQFWDELYSGTDVYSVIHQLRQSIVLRWIDELTLPPGAQVLEIGCGAGLAAVAAGPSAPRAAWGAKPP